MLATHPNRKVFFNEDYFESIDTEEQAYWLGFIMADGTIIKTSKSVKSHNRMALVLSEDDIDHLDKFKDAICHTGRYHIRNHEASYSTKNLCYLNCNSVKMCADLIKVGCTPSKTGYSNLPELNDELMRHFIRGYFDGDGCLSLYTQMDYRGETPVVRKKQEFSITSDENILLQIQSILVEKCDIPETKLKRYKRTDKAVSLRYGGKQQVKRLYNYLYQDSTIYLQRKYDKFSLLFS